MEQSVVLSEWISDFQSHTLLSQLPKNPLTRNIRKPLGFRILGNYGQVFDLTFFHQCWFRKLTSPIESEQQNRSPAPSDVTSSSRSWNKLISFLFQRPHLSDIPGFQWCVDSLLPSYKSLEIEFSIELFVVKIQPICRFLKCFQLLTPSFQRVATFRKRNKKRSSASLSTWEICGWHMMGYQLSLGWLIGFNNLDDTLAQVQKDETCENFDENW